jgi:hypothetical protein
LCAVRYGVLAACFIAAAFTHDSTLQIKRQTAHYITILQKIQILPFESEQSVSRVVNPISLSVSAHIADAKGGEL